MKYQVQSGNGVVATATTPDGRTRDRVAQLLLERGAATAAQLGEQLGLSPAAIRKHLDAMLVDHLVETREVRSNRPRGRGRPAKAFVLTAAARENFPHLYDGIATAALRWIAETGGSAAVSAFAASQVSALEERCRTALQEAGDDPIARAEALAEALTAEGYAASSTAIATGGQLCQHHCPVAHVAAEFPQLCDAETEVISRLIGTHVQRLATIAHGDGVCTTHIPASARWSPAPSEGPGAGSKPASALWSSAPSEGPGVGSKPASALWSSAPSDGPGVGSKPASALWSSAPSEGPGVGSKPSSEQNPLRVTAPTTVRTGT